MKELKKMKIIFSTLAGVAAVVSLGLLMYHTNSANATEKRPGQKDAVVIAELFTSEGCSSCPSADRLLARIVKDQPIRGAFVVALSEHVDYWNRLGWKDPYSSEAYTNRQRDYAQRLKLDSVYTPQLVIDGQKEFVGSDEESARTSIANAAKQPKANITITKPEGETLKSEINLPYKIESVPAARKGDEIEIFGAITEDSTRSHVSAGENSGSTLDHVSVVRVLKKMGALDGKSVFEGKTNLNLGSLNPEKSHLVIFLQERKSRRILGAATQKL